MLSFIFLVLLAHSFPIQCQNLLKDRKNIIILAGQSNMAGRGGESNETGIPKWDGVVPPQCQPNPSVFRLSVDLAWVEAREPLHADIDSYKTNGIGPGMSFANAVLTRDPNFGVLGLVPCAIGGTNISQWQKGSFLYQQLVERAQMAVKSGGAYRAMLWYQGESDTINQEDAVLYKGRLQRFFNDIRSDLQEPSLPIIQVALASGEGPYIEEIREAQLVTTGLENVKYVDAKGLPLLKDGLHLTTLAQVRLGEMLADSFLEENLSRLSTNEASPAIFLNFFPYFLKIVQVFMCIWLIICLR